jgi:tripartite ATP-independent transporter DctP family solute receptor
MKMNKTRFLILGLAILMSVLLAGCIVSEAAGSGAAITIRVGHVLAPEHPYQLGLEKFGSLVSEKTNGNVKVEVFHSSQLGNERDLIESLQLGTVEMCVVSTAPLSSFTTKFSVFDLPFIFSETNKTREILDGPIGQGILDTLDAQGIIGLCYFENGFRNITNKVRPITKPEDLRGLKIRTMESPIHMASFRVMGADPTPMALGELFTALQQGTVDGQENPLAIINTSKFFEVQKYLSITEHFYAPAPLLIGKSFYDRLDADSQKAVKEAAVEARVYERGLLDDMNTRLKDELQKAGMVMNTVDKQPFIDAVQSVYTEYEDVIGKELIQQVQDAQK